MTHGIEDFQGEESLRGPVWGLLLAMVLVLLISVNNAYSATKTWTGATSTDWGTAGNWSAAGVPASGDDVIIPTSPTGGRWPTIDSGTYAVKTLTFQANAVLNQTDGTLQIGGAFKTATGCSYNGTGGTVQFTANGTGDFRYGTVQFFHVIINSGVNPAFDGQGPSVIRIAGNFTNSNTGLDDDQTKVTTIFNGPGDQTIYSAASSGKRTFGNLTIDKSSGTLSLTSSCQVGGNVTITNGTFDIGSYTFSRTASGGTLAVQNSALFNIGGTSGMPTSFTTRTFSSTSTVDYYGTNQTVSAQTYGHLTLSGSGTKTMPGSAFTVAGNFTMSGTPSATAAAAVTVGGNFSVGSGCTFGAGSYSHNIAGTFTNDGTFTASTSTINLNGSSAQTIGGATSTTFNNLTVNNASGVSLSTSATVNSTLTLTNGKVTLGSSNLTIGSSGTISGATAAKYIITDSTGTLIRHGVGTSAVAFPIGTAASYLPLTAKTGNAAGGGVSARVTGAVTPTYPESAAAVQATWITAYDTVNYAPTEFTFQWNGSDEGASFVRATGGGLVYGGTSWLPAGTTTVSGSNPYTATVTGVSQYGSYIVANGGALSGKVFEDVNYGGGVGRNWATASGNGGSARYNARVELFNSSGAFVTSTTTDGSGNYTFGSLTPGNYTVRVVTGSVTSSRTGYTTTCLPVMTYRTNASSGVAVDVTDYVGGHDPATADAGDAASGWALNNSTGVFSGSGSGKAHAFAPVTVGVADVTGVDFGWNFDTVTNTNNSGQGSLRQFITNANTLGDDTSLSQSGLVAAKENAVFMISNGTAAAGLRSANNYFVSGVATISPTSALPAISTAMVLDAQKQPGWTTVPIVELSGAGAGYTTGLDISAGNSIVRGFVVNRFDLYGIQLSTAGGNVIQGNYLGTNAAGTAKAGNQKGIMILGGSASNIIGGSESSQRNILSGNTAEGLYIQGAGSDTNIVRGNYIGTDASGTVALGNKDGIGIHSSSKSNVIGGAAAGEGNVIAGNSGFGVWMSASGTNGHTFLGNRIGTDLSGTVNLGNTSDGIYVSAGPSSLTIGGRAAGEGNVIAFNGGKGINLYSFGMGVTSDRISGNSIFSNAGLGIDLENDGQTPNDGMKTGAKANLLMDYPVFTMAILNGTTLHVGGYVGSAPNQSTFANAAVEIFKSDNDATGYGEGQTYLGYLIADANGNFNGSLTVSGLVNGDKLTATATDGSNNTSEFGPNYTVIPKTIDCSLSDWCSASNDFCVNDEGGNNDWTNPAKLDITRFAVSSNLADSFYLLMGFDDVPVGGASTAALIDKNLDGYADFAYAATVNGASTTVELYSCDNTLFYGCGAASLLKTYTTADYCVGTAPGPWNSDTFVEARLPYSDLGFVSGNVMLTTMVSYADKSLLKSPKDSVFQNLKDRVRYSTSDGNNQKIPGPETPFVSGIVYADEGTTFVGAGKTVRLLVNGVDRGWAVTDAAGGYIIFSSVSLSAGDAIVVYIDNDATYRGTTATVMKGIQITDLDIYTGHIITRHDNGGTLTNANLSAAKGAYSDTDILYSVTSGALTVGGSGTVLYVPTGHSLAPGGNVTTPSMKSLGTFDGGSGSIDVNGTLTIAGGTFTASSGTMYVAGNMTISGGTFNNNSGTMTFDGTDATINVGAAVLNNMTVDKTNYTLTMASPLTVSGSLTITSGIFNQGASYNLISGPVAIGTDGTLRNRGTGSLTLSGDVVNNGKIDFNGGGDDVCGSATESAILSSVNGMQRLWSGSGIFDMVDVDVNDQAGSASITVYSGTNSGNNGTNWIFNAGCTSAPTAVNLVSCTAKNYNGDVLIQWRTGFEVDNLGFHVYREEGGRIERLTPELVAGSALRAGPAAALRGGRFYMWVDSSGIGTEGAGVQYYLEDVDLQGTRTWHGPVVPETASEPLPERFTPRFLSELGQKAEGQYDEYWRIQDLKARLSRHRPARQVQLTSSRQGEILRPPSRTAGRSVRSAPEIQRSLAARHAVKILIKEEGWYRVTIAEINAKGLYPRDPRHLQLFVEGREIPILVKTRTPRRLDPQDTVEFFGKGLDTPSTDTRVYWLTEAGSPGKRIPYYDDEGREGQPAQPSFPFTTVLEERIFYFAALKNGEAPNFFGAMVANQGTDKIITAFNLDPAAPEDGMLEVSLQGVTETPHRVKVLVNNLEVGDIAFEGQSRGYGQLSVPQTLLLEGENLVTLVSQNGDMDVSLIDSIKLTYKRIYRADGDMLTFSASGGWALSVGGFTGPSVGVFDVTDPDSPYRVHGTVTAKGTGHSVSLVVPGDGQRTLMAFAEGKAKSPHRLEVNKPSEWHNPGNSYDIIIISYGDFLQALGPLQSLRKGQGHSVALIDVEDLYDEFSFGNKDPQAIKDFLYRTKVRWRRVPPCVLLVGDASFDPRNYLETGDYDLVPTKLVETAYLETASDDWFVDFNGDGLPETAIGRLPVRTAAEASAVVGKILGYEQSRDTGSWRNQALIVTDENEGFDFEGAGEALRNLFPTNIAVRTLFWGRSARDEQARDELLTSLSQGALIVNYVGHGSEDGWGTNILSSNDSPSLVNGLNLPFFIAMTCLNGYFHDIYTESLAEALLKTKQGGAIAIAASSGLTEPGGQAMLNEALIGLLFGDEPLTLGTALLRAKAAVPDGDIRRTFMLFGDPAVRLRPATPSTKNGRLNR